MILDAEEDIEVVGEAADGAEAVALARAAASPTSCSWTSACPSSTASRPRAQVDAERAATAAVLILTTFDLDEYVYEALRAGASGFLLKDAPPEQLVARHPGRRRRRGAARALDHAPADRGVRRAAARPAARRRRAWTS